MIRRITTAALVAVAILTAALAGTARASSLDANLGEVSYAYSNVQTSLVQVTKLKAVVGGKIQVRGMLRNGLSQAQKQGAEQCLVAANDNKPGHGKTCGHIKIGTVIVNSGILITTNAFGTFYYKVKAGDTFYLINGQWYKGRCGNKVWIHRAQPPMKPIPLGKVEEVVDFRYTWKLTFKATLAGSGSVYAYCSVTNAAGSASARATAYAYGFGSVNISLIVKGKSSASVTSKFRGGVNVSESDTQNMQGQARVQITNTIHVSAVAVCNGTPPGVGPPPPPGFPPPPPPPAPKDGTQGPGNGTPGSAGGYGSGGSPGVTTCRDSSGNMVPGTPDASGNCPGVTNGGGTTGGSSPGGPPPPPPSYCIDPVTLQSRVMQSNETKDQFGYCIPK